MNWLSKSLVTGVLLAAAVSGGSANAQGTLRVAFGASLNTLDPAKTKIGEEYIQNFLIYSGVPEIDRDGNHKPDLAESWPATQAENPGTAEVPNGLKHQ